MSIMSYFLSGNEEFVTFNKFTLTPRLTELPPQACQQTVKSPTYKCGGLKEKGKSERVKK
jgi:hypothetical protein